MGSSFLREGDDEGVYLPEENFTLLDVLTEQAPLFYIYDLGDRWLHRLELIETLPPEPDGPRVTVIRGERRCHLEESGGTNRYDHILDVLSDPGHHEHNGLTQPRTVDEVDLAPREPGR